VSGNPINNFISAIRTVLKRIFGSDDKKVPPDIAVSSAMTNAINRWGAEYSGTAPRTSRKNIRTMGIAAAVSSEIARSVTLEFKSEITGSPRADFLNSVYSDFLKNIRLYTELACAKGGVAFKPYISGKTIGISVVQADGFFPSSFDAAGNVTGAAFTERYVCGSNYYTRVEYHSFEPTVYTVINKAFSSNSGETLGKEISLTDVSVWADIEPYKKLSDVKAPLFSYFKIPNANFIDSESPLGVSVFAKAEPLLADADEIYSQLIWEFKSGQRKIIASLDALKKQNDDGTLAMPTLDDGVFVALDTADQNFYQAFSPELRDEPIRRGLDRVLRQIELLCGLASGTIADAQTVEKTATEMKISKQRTYSTVADIQRSLKQALEGLVYAMDYYAGHFKLAPAGKLNISFDFDDSVIVDAEYEQKLWLQEVAAGLMSPEEYRMRRYGETLEQAKNRLPKAVEDGDE